MHSKQQHTLQSLTIDTRPFFFSHLLSFIFQFICCVFLYLRLFASLPKDVFSCSYSSIWSFTSQTSSICIYPLWSCSHRTVYRFKCFLFIKKILRLSLSGFHDSLHGIDFQGNRLHFSYLKIRRYFNLYNHCLPCLVLDGGCDSGERFLAVFWDFRVWSSCKRCLFTLKLYYFSSTASIRGLDFILCSSWAVYYSDCVLIAEYTKFS